MKNKIITKKLQFILAIAVFLIALSTTSNSQVSELSSPTSDFSPSAQYYQPTFSSYYSSSEIATYWPILGREDCQARQDFILSIAPGGCQPAVVRSDLLEEQNVPVFCEVDAVKINPLIDVKAINSMSFRGKYPAEVSGAGFHPARAAVRSYNTLLGSPLVNNIGYLVIVLKRQPSEKNMPDWVEGTLTARINYDMEKAFGIGRGEFFLPVLTDREWENTYEEYGFWRGKGFLRAEEVSPTSASLSVYRDATHKEATTTLTEGKTSGDIYLGGFYCQAALQLKLKDLTYPQTKAKIIVQKEGEENELWLYKNSRFVEDKCSITSIDSLALGGGSVEIRCGSQKFTLRLGTASSVGIKIDNEYREVAIWDSINEDNKIVYVAHVGQVPKNIVKGDIERSFIVLLQTSNEIDKVTREKLTISIKSRLENLARTKITKENFKTKSEEYIKGLGSGITNVTVLFYGETGKLGIKFEGAAGSVDKAYEDEDGKVLDEYFDKAISEYRKVVQLYPNEKEKQPESAQTYGEKALQGAAKLAKDVKKQKTEQELLREGISNYAGTLLAADSETKLSSILRYDEENAIETIKIGYSYYTFHLQDIVEPSEDEASATISLDTNPAGTYTINDYIISPEDVKDGKEFIKVKGLDEEYVTLTYDVYENTKDGNKPSGTKEQKVKLKEPTNIGNHHIYISDIKLQRVANVVVEPRILGPYTETNISFKIGIEKRAIKLSTDKTKEMIQNINKSINDWEKISSQLAKVVKGWKGACYATSAVLIIKNLVDNFSGKSMARQKVMRGPGGWVDKCKDFVSKGQYETLDKCLYENNAQIEKEVNTANEVIKKINDDMKATEKIESTSIFGEKTLNTEKSFYGFMDRFKSTEGSDKIPKYDENGKETGETFTMSELIGDPSQAYSQGFYTFTDAREWAYYTEMAKNPDVSPEMQAAYKKKLSDIYSQVNNRRIDYVSVSDHEKYIKTSGRIEVLSGSGKEVVTSNIFTLNSQSISNIGNSDKLNYNTDYLKTENSKQVSTNWIRVQIPSGTYVEKGRDENGNPIKDYSYGGKDLLVPLSLSSGKYIPTPGKSAYVLNYDNGAEKINDTISSDNMNQIMGQLGVNRFSMIEKGKCINPYKSPQVRFFDVEPQKNMPGVVPIDVREGWYVGMKQTIKGFGLTPYTDAGLLKNFYLCNVGTNGREEFDSGIGDDICTFTSFETGASINHPCLSEADAKRLADKARQAVMEAAQQYASGLKKIRIMGQEYDVGVPVGGAEGTQCQDYMSPQDCYILFNTCDPVLCPASRCNLGGNYYVKDVVQSGIIGSIALCLPNAREGIFVPVCLTGVQAGLDAYISILKSHRDCLQESLNTGKMVGVCDEIYSIYLCEFFWRQFAPLMDIFIPKMVELAYGKGTRGGGEYATITHAWNTMDNSVKYFTNFYAESAYKAFTNRATDQAGTEVCKMFVSARYPASKNFFDALLEPDSPVQYSAWFNEIPFTEATVPATSHYKVFYHIYAGKDKGSHYEVYLKNPPESSFYATTPTIYVDTGYVGKGSYISQTKDFTAPAGYKSLCVRIDLQEECGFGQVSTSYAVNYIEEKYIKDQATKGVTSEKECISGTPSLYSAIQPNLQEGVQETIQPSVYKSGIIRVCSTDNPGKQTAPDRWSDVGYCDNEKLRCWIDLESVKNNVKNNQTLTEIKSGVKDLSQNRITELVEKGEVISDIATRNMLTTAEGANGIEGLKIITTSEISSGTIPYTKGQASVFAKTILSRFNKTLADLDNVTERGYWNYQKAKAILLRAQIYDYVTREIFKKIDASETTAPTTTITPETKATSETKGVSISTLFVGDILVKNNIQYRVTQSISSGTDWVVMLVNVKDSKDKPVLRGSKDKTIEEFGYSYVSGLV